jgi:hypothetical protein
MEKYIFFLIMITATISCNTKKTDNEAVPADTTATNAAADSVVIKDSHYFWTSGYDPKQGLIMVKTRPASADSLTAPIIVQMFNETYPEIPLTVTKISNDSVFINIRNSKYLTQQMGSSGAEAYLAELTYNLTEISGINFVDIKFKVGDHASPGTYSRTDFINAKN